jgi:hypothetical protein
MLSSSRWPVERVLFALAGTVTLVSARLTFAVSELFLVRTAIVGGNHWVYVTAGGHPASVVLRRAGRLRSAIYESGQGSPMGANEVNA